MVAETVLGDAMSGSERLLGVSILALAGPRLATCARSAIRPPSRRERPLASGKGRDPLSGGKMTGLRTAPSLCADPIFDRDSVANTARIARLAEGVSGGIEPNALGRGQREYVWKSAAVASRGLGFVV